MPGSGYPRLCRRCPSIDLRTKEEIALARCVSFLYTWVYDNNLSNQAVMW